MKDSARCDRRGRPTQFEKTPSAIQGPGTRLGEHTHQVLRDLGYDANQVSALLGEGATVSADCAFDRSGATTMPTPATATAIPVNATQPTGSSRIR